MPYFLKIHVAHVVVGTVIVTHIVSKAGILRIVSAHNVTKIMHLYVDLMVWRIATSVF